MSKKKEEDVFLISSALEEALKRPGSAEQSFVWQDKTQTTPAIVKRIFSEAPTLVDPAKRRKAMKQVPHYAEIGRTPVSNAPIRRELDAEKVRWDNHVRECLRMLTTLQLVTEEPESVPDIDPVYFLHHTIASLGALSLSITQFRRVAVHKLLEGDKPGSTPLFAETELKLLKHKDTLHSRLRGRSSYSSFHPGEVVLAKVTRFGLKRARAKVKERVKASIDPSTWSVLQKNDIRQRATYVARGGTCCGHFRPTTQACAGGMA